MAKPKPTVLIAHGIWHSPPTYSKLITALQTSGYEVYCPYLPSCTGIVPPTTSLHEDVQLFRRLVQILVDQGKEIVIIMHSYGGAVACNAIEGLDKREGEKGGVVHLIGLSAHIHPKDFAIMDLVHEMGDDELIPLAFDISAEDGSCFQMNPKAALFSDIPDEEADMLLKTLSRANWRNLKEEMWFEGWKGVEMTYVVCLEDCTMPVSYQRRMLEKVEKAGGKVEVVEMKSGHSPHVSRTEEVVKVVDEVVRKLEEM